MTNSDDGNKQTLKLKKEEETTAEMTAEDIAKLVDAEKPTVNPDGTYTLTRTETILDAEGNPRPAPPTSPFGTTRSPPKPPPS